MASTLEDVQTDAAQLVDVGMEDLGKKSNFRRSHGVIVW